MKKGQVVWATLANLFEAGQPAPSQRPIQLRTGVSGGLGPMVRPTKITLSSDR